MSRQDAASDLGEVYFEYTYIGAAVRVAAIHAATGTETVVMGPAHAATADHAVSEAVYLWDPDGLGIEVDADRSQHE